MLATRLVAALACMAMPLSHAQEPPELVFSGTAKSAVTGDFVPNACAYEEFSTQFVSAAESRFAYVSAAVWDADEICGRCANVTLAKANAGASVTPNSTITVMLISHFQDECGNGRGSGSSAKESRAAGGDERDCRHDLLLSDQAYRDMLNQSTGSRFRVDWQLVKCPSEFVDGGIEFAFDDATSPNLLTVQPRNFHGLIESMAVKFEDGTKYPFGSAKQAFGSFRQVILADGKHNFSQPFTLMVTEADTHDEISVAVTEQPVANQVIVTDKQF